MRKKIFLSLVVSLLVLMGCSRRGTSVPLVNNLPVINTSKVLYVLGAGEERAIPFLGGKTILFRTDPVLGIQQNGKDFAKFLRSNLQVEIIVAHSFGANALISAVGSNPDLFRDKKILLLCPVFAGSKSALGSSEFFPQLMMGIVSWFGAPDFRVLTQDVDPLGEGVLEEVELFVKAKHTLDVVCFLVKGDSHAPDKDSPRRFKENYQIIFKESLVLLPKTNHPHTEVLERIEVSDEVARTLITSRHTEHRSKKTAKI